MRSSIRAASFLLPAFVAIACGRQMLDDGDEASFAGTSGAAGAGAGVAGPDAGAAGKTAGAAGRDAGGAAGKMVPPTVEMSPMCAELAAGGSPDVLRVFNWWVAQVGCSDSPSCFTQVVIDGCDLDVQSAAAPAVPAQMFTLAPQDCQAARGWVSNARFLGALGSGIGCEKTARREAFDVALTGVSPPFTSTNFCPEPTIQAVRTCLGALVARLTHKPWP